MGAFKNLFHRIRALFVPRPSTELGRLLPTVPRDYFTSFAELPFLPGAELNFSRAWWCAEAAMLAYQEPGKVAELTAHLTPAGWQVRTFGGPLRTSAVLLTSSSAAILAFRGTRVSGFRTLQEVFTQPPAQLEDLQTDFSFSQKTFPQGGSVHEGFLDAFEEFWRAHAEDLVRGIGARGLFVTGHSLGGALATIAALRIDGARVVHTFGSPRVGDGAFRALFVERKLPVYRFVHALDLVTMLPPEGLFGFTHVGELVHLRADAAGFDRLEYTLADVLARSTPLPIELVRDGVRNVFEGRWREPLTILVPQDGLADHAPIRYVEKVRGLALEDRGGANFAL